MRSRLGLALAAGAFLLAGLAACENSIVDRGLDRLADQVVEASTPAGRAVRLAGLAAALCDRIGDDVLGRANCTSLHLGAAHLVEAAAEGEGSKFEAALDAAKVRLAIVVGQVAAREYGIDPASVGMEIARRLLDPSTLERLAGSWFRLARLRAAVEAADAGHDGRALAEPYLARLSPE